MSVTITPIEVHLTVTAEAPAELDTLASFAAAHGLRLARIVLDAGLHPVQPMLSWRQEGGLPEAHARCGAVAASLEPLGLRVVRLKVETGIDEAAPTPPVYFEGHFKVRLEPYRLRRLAHTAAELGAHLSANAHATTDVFEERFLTVRAPDAPAARRRFADTAAGLEARGWSLCGAHEEAVLFDSNLALDRGWIR